MGIPVINRYFIARTQAKKRKRHAMWQAMRILREFTATDIEVVAEAHSKRTVLAYLSQLRRAGFLKEVGTHNRGKHERKRFRLIRNTGPNPPAIIAKRNSMFDLNTDQEHPFND